MNNDYINRYTGESKRSSSRMVSYEPPRNPCVAIVRNHLDSSFMGSLQVQLVDNTGSGNNPNASTEYFTARYLAPFYGVTPLSGVEKTEGDQYTQKSYGMWFIPPDIGSLVLVIFAESGDAYWIGCIPEKDTNFMVPSGDAATTYSTELDDVKRPVAEINKKLRDENQLDATKIPKPVNSGPDEILRIKGLDADETRGLTTSSARREVPSAVFGISTPGPYDRREGAPRVDYGNAEIFHNRLGGSSIVMDDGDATLLRKTTASEGPSEYADIKKDETDGDVTIPHNEMLRLKTRTGHQILMHNSEDLIYIGNSTGTTWIELTSNGKIDIYAKDSVSVHTEADLNFKADRDVNIEAGRDFNVKAKKNITMEAQDEDFQLIVGKDNKITTTGKFDLSVKEGIKITTPKDTQLSSENNVFTANTDTDINSGGNQTITTGSKLRMNGPTAKTAEEAEDATALTVWSLPRAEDTIMRRVPQAEPWIHHENLGPQNFTPEETDVKKPAEEGEGITSKPPQAGEYIPTADTFRRGADRGG